VCKALCVLVARILGREPVVGILVHPLANYREVQFRIQRAETPDPHALDFAVEPEADVRDRRSGELARDGRRARASRMLT
jgi:hypothetical protein